MLKKKLKEQEDQEEQEFAMKQYQIGSQQQQNAMKQVKQAKISQNAKQVTSNMGQVQVNNLFMQQRNMAAAGNSASNPNINVVNKRNSTGLNPNSHTMPNDDNGQAQRDFFIQNKKTSVRKKEESIVTPPIILKIGTLTTNSEHSMSADDNYFMPRTTNRQCGGTITGSGSPKVKMVESEPISDFVNSGRQSLRRMSNLPGIKQRVMNDSTVNQIKQQIMMKNNQNSLMMVDGQEGNNHQPRFLTNIVNARNIDGSGSSPLKGNQGSFQTVTSRNKVGGRGPKTIGNRTQGDEAAIIVQKNMKISTYSGSPDRPISTFTQPGKLREIQSTFQLLQAYQPGNNKPDIFKALALENSKSSGTVSQGGSVESDTRIKQFGGTFKNGGMDLKSKRSEINSKRGTKRSSKPPILPSGIVAPQSQSNTPSLMVTSEIPVLKKVNKNGVNNVGAFSTYSGGQSSANYQNSSYFVASPDERVKSNINSKLPQTKMGRNYQFQQQQPHTVREDVVQISATISSTNTSQQKPAVTSVKDNHLRTPLKIKTILLDNNNRGSQPPSTMQVWSAVTMGSGSDLGSQDDGLIPQVNKRNFGRPSAIIKIRRKEGTINNINNKLATLRAASNDSLEEKHSRQRNDSIGSEVAIIEEGNLISDVLEGSVDDENSIERQQRRRRESQGAFHKMIQLKQQSKTKRLAVGLNEQVNNFSNPSRNSPLARGGVNYPAPPGTNETNLSPSIQGNGQRTQPLEITQSSLTDSQKQLLNNGHHRNRLPPSLKNYERDAILLSSGTLSNHLNTSNKESVEINDVKKKMSHHQPNLTKQSENALNQQSKLQIVEERRTSKFISMGGGNQQQFRNNSQPAPSLDQHSSSTSSKIDKILAKIEKNRSDSVLKNQIGQILKKNQLQAQTTISENCLNNQDSNRREASSQQLNIYRKDHIVQDDNSPISNNLQRIVIQPKQAKAVDESAGSSSASNIVKQHQKILKLVSVANTNTLMNPSVTSAYNTIQPQSSSLQNGKIKKKSGIKISKGSLEKAQQAYTTLQNNPHINDIRRQQQSSIKQLRDARSQDIVTNMIEKQGIYLPAEMSQESEFSPSGQINSLQGQGKKAKKKIMIRVKSNEEQKSSKEGEVINKLVITTSGDSQIVYQPSIAEGGGIKPFKKSIIQSMQPQQPKKVSHQLTIGTNSQQMMVFSSDGSDKQSTEISSHTNPLYPRPSNNALNQNQQDQSSLLCITSTSNQFKNQIISNQHKRNSNQKNPMTIMDGVQSPMNSLQNKPTQILFQFPHQSSRATKADRTSMKDNNPLDNSVNQPQKISARYHLQNNNQKPSDMQITEDAKEESNSSASNQEEKKAMPSPPSLKRQTLTMGGSRRITMPGTVNTSSINHEEPDLHIEPIDSDDKLFKQINLSSRKQQLIRENRQLFDPTHSYRRLKKGPSKKVTTVIEGSELASSNASNNRQQLVVSRVTNNGQLNNDIQRYSELETEEVNEMLLVKDQVGKIKSLNRHHFQSSSDDEEEDEIRINEEDDEAIMISNHQYAHTTLVPEPQKDSQNVQRRQSQIKKQKHWLLDSDRFDIMLHNNATQQHQIPKDADSESNMMQSDTVIFEKDQSSLHGTPPKISQKINQKTPNIQTGGDVQEYEENDRQLNQVHHQDNNNNESSSACINDSSRAAMINEQEQKLFSFTQDSYDEIRDARQNAYVARLLLPMDHTDDNKKTVQRLVKDLTKQMNIGRSDYRTANNPHWVMQKQLRHTAPLEHYLRPTYYDVIYLQPQLDPATSVANQVGTVTQSGNSQVSSVASKVRSSMVVGGSISKYQRPSAGFDQRYLKSKIKPQLEEFNFDTLFRQ